MVGKGTVTTKTLFKAIEDNREAIHHAADGMIVSPVRPLTSWPAYRHPRQDEIETFKAIPSLVR